MADLSVIQEKLNKGETLNAEETKAVMSAPPSQDDWGNDDDSATETVKEEKKKEERTEEKKEEKKEPERTEAEMRTEFKEMIEAPYHETDIAKNPRSYSVKEKAYFHELRQERKARQRAEHDLEQLKFQNIKEKATAKVEQTETKVTPGIEGDDDEFLTKGELKKTLKQLHAESVKDLPASNTLPPPAFNANYVKLCETYARKEYLDYDEVINCWTDIVENNNAYKDELISAINSGLNAAELAYHLIKDDPDFDDTIVKVRAKMNRGKTKETPKPSQEDIEKESKRKEAEEKEKRIKENNGKVKTSGNFPSGSGDKDAGDYTLLDIYNMSDADYFKLPRAKRDMLHKKFG